MNEIKDTVRALRDAYEETDKVYFHLRTIIKAAASLIESLQAQLAAEQITSQSLRNAANGYKLELALEKRRADAAVEERKE